MKPRLLDLCGGAGGAARGYQRAGFYVVSVDIRPQRNCLADEHYQADAVEVLALLVAGKKWRGFRLHDFAAIHASPPCQRWTRSSRAAEHPDLITPLRELMEASGLPYVVENVPRAPLRDPVVLCGSSFGLRVRRHRGFESNVAMAALPCAHTDDFVTVAGGGPNPASFRRGPNASGGPDRKPRNVAEAGEAMGIHWMTRRELNEAIPPAYTEHVGGYLIVAVTRAEAA